MGAATLGAVMALGGCSEVVDPTESESWRAQYPEQYESWAATETLEERVDILAQRPALVVLWGGSAYAKEFHSPRGHQFSVADVTHTLRTGEGEGNAACWSCKSPDAARLMAEQGENGFAAHEFAQLGKEMGNAIGCADCHEPGSETLRLARPFSEQAMAKIKQPFETQSRAMQGSQTCGQCHVTYYFQPEEDNRVNIPWIFGSTADDIEKYYDTRRFYDWIHPVSGAFMVKARHPEFEHWSRSNHAKLEVGCVDCHMPANPDGEQAGLHDHKVGSAMENFDRACARCHKSEERVVNALAESKAAIDAKRNVVEALLVKAHYEAKAAQDNGASFDRVAGALMDIRHAQWRWDFATSSHGIHAHNPQEGLALLEKAQEQVTLARAKLAIILDNLGVASVVYPDISTKEKAQQALAIELEALTEQKRRYLESEVIPHWPQATSRGY